MNGLESYTSGDINVLGMVVGDNSQVLDQVRKRVGMVFQNFNLFSTSDHSGKLRSAAATRLGSRPQFRH